MIIFHTALHAEAHALIQYFSLKREHHIHMFPCFRNAEYFLIESGIGKLNTAAAIAWYSAYLNADNPVYFNIGIAGHGSKPVGHACIAHCVEDQATRYRIYPAQISNPAIDSDNVLTVDHPGDDYPDNSVIDMEASAFFHTANRFTTLELIQSLKVISDNQKYPANQIRNKNIKALIAPHLTYVENLIQKLTQLQSKIMHTDHVDYPAITQRWNFSQYQRQQLKRLLQRHQALTGNEKLLDQIPDSIINSKTLITWLFSELATHPLRYS